MITCSNAAIVLKLDLNMNYNNNYNFVLDSYKRKMDSNSDIIAIRKAIEQSISNESFQVRQQYRHEMARKRREAMENQRVMNQKMKEIKEKEKEIALRYRKKDPFGKLIGTRKKSKIQGKTVKETITVLLPVVKKKDIESSEKIEYESHCIAKTLLPTGKEDLSAYEIVKKSSELSRKYGGNDPDGGSGDTTLHKQAYWQLQKPIHKLDNDNKDPMYLNTRKHKETKMDYQIHGAKRRYFLNSNSVYQNSHHGPSYDKILSYYRCGGGLYRDELSVFGKAKNASKYELLIVDDGLRTEEIRVKQKTLENPRVFDILTIKENTKSITPDDWRNCK